MNFFRRISLSRLLVLCGAVIVAGASLTAIASAVDSGPTPPPKPLAQAAHDALSAPSVQGFSARITLTNHLLEGASLASGGSSSAITSSPLIAGGKGRLWIAADGRFRLELQAEAGDTQLIYDGHTLTLYDAANDTVYRYTPPAGQAGSAPAEHDRTPPTVAQIEQLIARANEHWSVSGATPTDVGGRAAYTVRLAPKQGGSLLGGVELSFDAANGTPLRAAIYSSTSPDPVIELAADEVSYGPIEDSVFTITPPAGAKVEQIMPPSGGQTAAAAPTGHGEVHVTSTGSGLAKVAIIQKPEHAGQQPDPLEGLPKVSLGSVQASELRTELGTILSFERGGVRYIVAGSVEPAAIEAIARGL